MNFREAKNTGEAEGTESTGKERKTLRVWIRIMVAVVAIGWLSYVAADLIMRHRQKVAAQSRQHVAVQQLRAPGDCTFYRTCRLVPKQQVFVDADKKVCFDPPPISIAQKVGYRVTVPGKIEAPFVCTFAQVESGSCNQMDIRSFRFDPPQKDTELPSYWFRKKGEFCEA